MDSPILSLHTSPNDHRTYRYLTLANQLRVLLIEDHKTEKSAAALAVNAGHFDDPDSRQGMAHFLEHMLFLGTETFPRPGEYQEFINRHGGSNNAWTGTEFTNYYFDLHHEFFAEGLHRFSQFFTCPTLDAQSVDKERNAIDSEYRLKLQDDVRRTYQVHKETVNPDHPFAKFSVGNWQTLGDRADTHIRDELLAFYQQHYSAERMTLVVQSNATLAQQAQWVETYFSAIPTRNRVRETIHQPLYRPQDLGLRIEIKPIKESRKLVVSFALPSIEPLYRTKPLTFISHLLGYEGKGSLYSWLKHQGWVNTLSAGSGVGGSNFKDFCVSFGLTPEGVHHEGSIIEMLFGYLALIRDQGVEAWRYAEKRQVLDAIFRFQEGGRAIDNVSHLVINMHHYAPEHIVCGDYLMAEFNPAQIHCMLAYLSPDNMRIQLASPQAKTDRVARWYDTPYQVQPIENVWLRRWRDPAPLDGQLTLPEANPFICDRLEPHIVDPVYPVPQCLVERAGMRVWHLHDQEYPVPKGTLFIAVDSEYAVRSARHIALMRLTVELWIDHLNELTYPAEVAGLSYDIYAHQGGFTLQLSGFSSRLPRLLELILQNRTFGRVDPLRFQIIRQQLVQNWENQNKGRPISQLFTHLTCMLQPNNPPVEQLLPHLTELSHNELPEFVRQLYKAVHLEILAHGDWQEADVRQVAGFLERELTPLSLPSRETRRRLVDISQRGTLRRELNCAHQDSALLIYYQSPSAHPRDIACFTLANHVLASTFFHELRTRQQLGYVVGTGNLPLNRHPGLILYIQSPVAGPQELLDAIELFIDDFYLVLMELSAQTWQESKQGLLSQLQEKDANLRTRSQRLWVSIGSRDFHFNQREKVAEAVAAMSRAELIRFLRSLRSGRADRVILCSYGDQHQENEHIQDGELIEDLELFQRHSRKFCNV
jgi:insulysin